MKKLMYLGLAVVSAFFLTSCLDDNSNEDFYIPTGGLTMVNGYAENDPLLFYIDGKAVQDPHFPLTFRHIEFARLYTGKRQVQARAYEETELLMDTIADIQNNKFYSVFIGGNKERKTYFFTNDLVTDSVSKQSSQPLLRFFNLSPDNKVVSLQVNDDSGEILFADRAMDNQESAVAHQSFSPKGQNLKAVKVLDENGNVLAIREDITLEKGKAYTFIFIGTNESTDKGYYIGLLNQAIN